MTETRVCKVCGKEFAPIVSHQKYCCKECAVIARNKLACAYQKKNAKQIKEQNAIRKGKAKKRACALDLMSGEDLLHYGANQMRNNDALRLHIPKVIANG